MTEQRDLFWKYCQQAAIRARYSGHPCDIDAHTIDALLVDNKWRCAVSMIALAPPGKIDPFGPSLDRIIPELGYVVGNVRVVCNIVNFAMNKWGEEVLRRFVNECRTPDAISALHNKANVKIHQ